VKTALATPDREPDPETIRDLRLMSGRWLVHRYGTAPLAVQQVPGARLRDGQQTINQYRAGLGLPPAGIGGLS